MSTLFAVQLAVGVVLLVGLLARYVRFVPDLFRFLLDYPGQALILALLYALVLGQVGTGFGIPYLFWNEDPQTRFCAALGATLLLGLVGINAYQLIPEASQPAVMRKVHDFTTRRALRLRPLAFLDPPPGTNASEIDHFLRLVRLPFLALLAAPALLPGLFPTVPRFVLLQPAPADSAGVDVRCVSVEESLPGYLVGLSSWLAGVLAGVLLLKVGIRVCAVFAPTLNRFAEGAGAALGAAWDRARRASVALGLAGEPGSRREGKGRIAPRTTGALVGFFAVALATFLLLALASFLPTGEYHSVVSPGLAICALLGLVAMALVPFELLPPRLKLPALALLVVWVGAANHDAFKLRFEKLHYDRAALVDLASAARSNYLDPSPPSGALVNDRCALENWGRRVRSRAGDAAIKPKLVVLCVSGGATRAAYWSAVVIDRLGKEIPGFHDHVRIITGASGGMVGTAHYVRWRYDRTRSPAPAPDEPGRPAEWVRKMPTDSLRRIAAYIALIESWKLFLPRLSDTSDDRGIQLERDWGKIRIPLSTFRDAERAGAIPSLIFSPMTVDDGRQLLISNLDLRDIACGSGAAPPAGGVLAVPRGPELLEGEPADQSRPYSIPAVEFAKTFPGADRLLLSTAARMNASFPFVSPAVNLPSRPPLRVVDAGYYDNYGIVVATAWVALNARWLAENTSGVVLVQVRDALSSGNRFGYPAPRGEDPWANLLTGFEFFTSVPDAVLQARSASMSFRSDRAIAELAASFARATGNPDFFTTMIFENSADVTLGEQEAARWPGPPADGRAEPPASTNVAMTWYLTHSEKRALETTIPPDALASGEFADRAKRLDRIRELEVLIRQAKGTALRGYLIKQHERARHYERIQALKAWWAADHAARPDRPTDRAAPADTVLVR